MTEKGLKVEFQLPSPRKAKEAPPAPVKDPVPRIARLLALAHKWEGMVRRGEVKDYAEIARRMGLSRARVTQICGLVFLSPRLQQQLLLGEQHVPQRRMRRATKFLTWLEQERVSAISS